MNDKVSPTDAKEPVRGDDNAGKNCATEPTGANANAVENGSGGLITGETSDGYHTFNELYEHRHTLFIALMHAFPALSWKAKLHDDYSHFPGWFVAGIETPEGQATYHLPLRLWDAFDVEELPVSPPWDGHTPDDVIKRITSLSQSPAPDLDKIVERLEGLKKPMTCGCTEKRCVENGMVNERNQAIDECIAAIKGE